METSTARNHISFSTTHALFAGLAGGIAEILWVMTWSALTPLQASVVAREITHSVFPGMEQTGIAIETGLIIHLAISAVLGVVFAWTAGRFLARNYGNPGLLAGGIVLLALIWAINFLLVLPALNPAFVTLMPASITFVSKILFGLAMSLTLITGQNRYETMQRIPVSG